MSVIIIPRKHLRQPQGRVTVNPRFEVFTNLYSFSDGLSPNLGSNGGGALENAGLTISTAIGREGVGLSLSNSDNGRLNVPNNPFGTSTCSYLWVESCAALDTNGSVISNSRYDLSAGNEAGSLQTRITTSGIQILRAQQAITLEATNARANGALNIGAATIAGNNGRHTIFSNGRLVAAATPATTYTHGASAIGNGPVDDLLNLFGPIYLFAFAPVALPDDLMRDLTASPWQLFRADPIRIYSLPSGPISWSSLTASGITQTGATLTLGGITR